MPRSRHADRFNHDDEADGYDLDVLNEADPIRAGYDACLGWVAAAVDGAPPGPVLDLGIGTGNLAARLPVDRTVLGVDVSERMLAIAAAKLVGRPIRLLHDDILGVFDRELPVLGAIVSSYALHHLEPAEKVRFLELVLRALAPRGVLAVGDLMFRDPIDRKKTLDRLTSGGHPEVVEATQDEYFWDLASTLGFLDTLGVSCRIQRFSALSWGFVLRRP